MEHDPLCPSKGQSDICNECRLIEKAKEVYGMTQEATKKIYHHAYELGRIHAEEKRFEGKPYKQGFKDGYAKAIEEMKHVEHSSYNRGYRDARNEAAKDVEAISNFHSHVDTELAIKAAKGNHVH